MALSRFVVPQQAADSAASALAAVEAAGADVTQAAGEFVDQNFGGLWTRAEEFLDIPIPILDALSGGEGTSVTVGSTLGFFIVVVIAWSLSRVVQAIAERSMHRRGITDPGTIGATQRLIHYTIMMIGLGVAIEVLGFDLTALFAAGAVVAVGLGFAMQNILQNFVSGFILLIERSIKPSDVIEVEGKVVKIEQMGVRSTIVRTWDDEQLIIPNTTLVQSTVKNFTLSDDLFRLRAEVGVAYGTDLDRAKKVLEESAAKMRGRSPKKDPVVLLTQFADSSIVFNVSAWIENIWTSRANKSDLHFQIWRGLRDAGITIAFPQLDVHLDSAVEDALRRGARGREAGRPTGGDDVDSEGRGTD